jgi:AraC family transcriptional regulator
LAEPTIFIRFCAAAR